MEYIKKPAEDNSLERRPRGERSYFRSNLFDKRIGVEEVVEWKREQPCGRIYQRKKQLRDVEGTKGQK